MREGSLTPEILFQLELKKLELQAVQIRAQSELKQKEVDLERARIEVGRKFHQKQGQGKETVEGLLSKSLKFVPIFDETRVTVLPDIREESSRISVEAGYVGSFDVQCP